MREWLVNFRESKGMTHEKIAESSNITRQYYGMIEKGERQPSVDVAKRIALILGFEWTLFFEKIATK